MSSILQCFHVLLLLELPAFGCAPRSVCPERGTNHSIIEWFGLEGTSQISESNPCCGQGHLPLDRVAESPIQPGLEHLNT